LCCESVKSVAKTKKSKQTGHNKLGTVWNVGLVPTRVSGPVNNKNKTNQQPALPFSKLRSTNPHVVCNFFLFYFAFVSNGCLVAGTHATKQQRTKNEKNNGNSTTQDKRASNNKERWVRKLLL